MVLSRINFIENYITNSKYFHEISKFRLLARFSCTQISYYYAFPVFTLPYLTSRRFIILYHARRKTFSQSDWIVFFFLLSFVFSNFVDDALNKEKR